MPNLNHQVSPSAIAFIDTQVENYQSLIAGVKPGTEVIVLDGNRDAIDQITEVLALRTNIDSIHIVSHGAPGSLQLGNGCLSADNLEAYSEQLQQWRIALTVDADILIYGCNVAGVSGAYPKVRQGMNSLAQSESRLKPTGNNLNKQSSSEDFRYEAGVSTPVGSDEYAIDDKHARDGLAFIQRIAQLTNANVAASQNLTGSVAKGGDWELEVRTGEIETPLVFEPQVLAGYEYVLNSLGAATNFPITYSLRKVASGDFNKDGNLDLAFASTGVNRNVSIALGDGTGQFGAATNLNTSPPSALNTWSVAVDDFNKDGNSDLVTANNATNNVSLLLGNGDGTFGEATYFGVGSSPYTVAVGDFNADGNPDLATANQTSNNVSILPGNGNGTFGAATNLSVGSTPYFVLVGDFNKDGKPDLATANSGSSDVSIVLQNADGTFGIATNFLVGNSPNYIALGDFNGDNNPDLATSNEGGSNNVSILLGTGTGSFSAATNFGVGTQPLAIASGDFNADGKVDLATANNGSGDVSVLFGSGNGSFGTATNFLVGGEPQGIVVGDFNKDGLSDLATANFVGQNTSILLNTPNTVNFGAATYSGTEGTADTVVNIPVTLSGTPGADVTVPIVLDPSSTATENSDYTFSPTSITFPAGATGDALTQNVAFTIKPDNIVENAETAILNLGTITGGIAGTTAQTTLTIAANDQPSTLSPYQIDLKTGTTTGGPNPFISLVNTPTDSNADSWLEAVAKINFDGNIKKAKFIVEYDQAPSGWTVNLGDSASNDGYGGDASTQSRDAEMNIVNGNMSVFGNDYNTPPGGELAPGNVPNFVTNASRVEFEVSNEQLGWDNKNGLKNSLNSPYLYALNGQVDATGPVNSEIYAGFNRVISGPGDRIGSGASKVTILLNPIDYAISAGVATVTEGNSGTTAATFTVTRSGCTELASTVDYAIAGSATNVSDYNNIGGTSGATGATGTINFAAGETSKTITLDVLGDAAIEANETLEVTLSNPSVLDSTPTITTASATTTISNDDTAGVSITPTETTATEAGTDGTYGVVLKSQPSEPVTISLTTGDQIQAIAPLTFTPDNWNVAQTVTVQAVNDTSVEGAHSANLTHIVSSADTNYNGIVVPGVTVAITDNDVVPPIVEPPGTTLSPYQINLKTGEITGQPNQFISLVNTPTDSNADSWLEAVAKINFDGKIKKAKFIVEYDKAPSGWTVNLGDSGSNDGYGGDASTQSRDAEMNIVNGSMSVFGNDYNTPPGGELTPGNVPNFVSNGSRVEFEVSNEQLGWDNKNGLKNSLNSPYLYALNGQVDATGPVNSEIYAGFNRVISGPGDRIGSGASKVTILLNPIDYAISAGVATVTEGNSGTTAATFTVTRSGCTELASTVDYAIAGTATNASDYKNIGGTSGATAATGTINFAAGETSKTITLDVLGDAAIEANETLEVTLSNPSVLDSTPTITTATATTTISNDDTAGFTINPTALSTSEVGGQADFTVKLDAQPTANVTIDLSSDKVAEGTVSPNTITFTPANYNEPQKVTVTGVDDLLADGEQGYKIVTAVAVSTDPDFNNLNPDDVTVTNSDNETPGVTVNPTAGLTTSEAGGSANFTVVLNTQPTANVTIGLNTDNVAEGIVSPNTITFTPANWSAPQQVTVTGVDDSLADGDMDYKVVTGATVSTDANYSNRDVADVSLSNKDDDTAGISITPTATTATEGGANGTYSAVLKSRPIAPVTITLTTGNQIETIAPLTFTPDNWDQAQTVTVKAVDDTVLEGAQSANITHTVTSTDAKYNSGIVVPGVTVAIADNDTATPPPPGTPDIIINPVSGLVTTEAGGTEKFTIKLNSQPTADVKIDLRSSDEAEGVISTESITFNSVNWDAPQEVTVTGVEDSVVDGDIDYKILTDKAVSTDPNYNERDGADVSLSNQDNDVAPPLGTPDIIINPVSGLVTTEAGGTEKFTIKLNSQPTADVKIDLRSSDEAEGVISTESITFNSANWDVPQEVTVTGVEDSVVDGDIDYKILTEKAVSTDSSYNERDVADVSLSNQDNDVAPPVGTPDIIINPVSGLVTTEAGGTEKFTIKLNSQPIADVKIDLRSSDEAEGVISTESITFNSANWDAPQEVTVTGVEDSVVDGDTAYKILTEKAVSTDPSYNERDVADVRLSNQDNDVAPPVGTPDIIINPVSGLVTTEAGGTEKFTIKLNSQPIADVKIDLRSSDEAEGVISTESITFNSANWDVPQEVTVTGVEDSVVDGDIDYKILTEKAVSTDPSYNERDVADVRLSNQDNEVAPPVGTPDIIINPVSGLITTEAGGTEKFTIKLNSQPTADVKIDLRSNNEAEGVISTESITFNSANWDVPQEVTVTGVEDSVVDGDIDYKIVTEKAVSTDPNYTNRDVVDVSLSNQDNDVVAPQPVGSAGILISPPSGLVTTEAGGTDTFTIKLTRPPTADVKIDLRSNNEAEGVISTESITFNSVNWDQWQPITITGVDDRVFDGDKTYQIVTAPAVSGDTGYNGLDVLDATVVNRGNTIPPSEESSSELDSDTAANPGITVSPTNGLITTKTGGKAKFTLALNSKPTDDVSIGLNVSPQNPTEGSLSTPGVTFTPNNWNIPQEVTVKGEGGTLSAATNRPYTIVTAPAMSSDSKYSGLDAPDVSLTNMFVYRDNYAYDQYPRIVVGPTNELITTEAGDTANFSVVLTHQPMADVVIPVSSDNTAEGTVSVSTLKFTPDNWDIAQIVTIKGINDNQSDGDRPYKIILGEAISNESADSGSSFGSPRYSGFDPQDVSVTNLERSYTFNKINTEISNYFDGGAISPWGDYSGDGKLDFLASGRPEKFSSFGIGSSSDFTGTWLYRNSGSTFTAESGYPSWESASAASWGDYNNDRQLDFLLQTNGVGKYQIPSSLKLFGNNGDGWNGSTIEYIGLNNSSSPAWGDYNNDGKPDILNATQQSITNENADGTFSTLENASLLYRNTGKSDILLTADITAQLPGVLNGSAAWGDYNKDGKPDILLTGDSVSGKIAKVFRNTGSGFSEAFALPGVSNGSAAWGDYDNDGDLDILLAGNSDSGNITKVYRNTGSSFSEDTTATLPGGSSAAWGDYDNEGKLDILLDSKVYRNTGSGFSEDTSAGVSGDAQGYWGDYDSDGKLDILLGNQVYRNDTAIANTRPTAPTELSTQPDGQNVTFNWNPATDAQTPSPGLSYNLRVGTTEGGQDILSPMSLNNGTRQVVGLGNANQNTTWQLKDLSPGTYYWSVQAIDAAWAGSEFATEGSFTVGNRPPEEKISLSGRYSEFNQAIKDVYTDPDGDQISYQLTLLDGSPLSSYPYSSWLGLEFDSPTNEIRFIGTPPTGAQPFRAKLIATDSYGASSEQIFTVTTYPGTDRWVIDGYIDGATVFLDANKNAVLDTNEPSTTTDSGGKFNLNIPFDIFDTNKNGEIDSSEGNLVATGGIDTATGLPLETPVTAPPDASVVTLLTTLVADLTDKGIEPEEAQSLVKAALGLPAEVDLTSLDPIEATNNNQPGGVQVLAEMVKVQNFITQTSGLIDGASSAVNTDIVKAVVSSITNQIESGTVLNLSNAAALEPIIQQSAAKIQQIDPSFNSQQVSQITSQSATVMATANQRIDAAVSNPTATSIPESLARLQQVALGPTTQDFKEVGTGNKPISQLVADNTGAALDSRIEAVVLPVGIATPVVSGDADLGSNSPNAILGTNGDDILTGDSTNNVLMGMRGNDSIDGILGNDTIFGGKASDTILGSSGDDVLFGNRGADILNGDDGNDILYGGKGDDLLTGGLGMDSLIGGRGVDKFLLSTNSGTDTITDFEVGKDLLVLGNGLSFSQLAIAQDSGATLIRFAQTGEILASLDGVSATSISAANFGLL